MDFDQEQLAFMSQWLVHLISKLEIPSLNPGGSILYFILVRKPYFYSLEVKFVFMQICHEKHQFLLEKNFFPLHTNIKVAFLNGHLQSGAAKMEVLWVQVQNCIKGCIRKVFLTTQVYLFSAKKSLTFCDLNQATNHTICI